LRDYNAEENKQFMKELNEKSLISILLKTYFSHVPKELYG